MRDVDSVVPKVETDRVDRMDKVNALVKELIRKVERQEWRIAALERERALERNKRR